MVLPSPALTSQISRELSILMPSESLLLENESSQIDGCDVSADYWKLVTDEDGNSFLENDGNADIFDEDGNFLVGAGTSPHAIQTALSKYLGVSMTDAYDAMTGAGMVAEGTSWNVEGNIGKRIAIGGASDMNTTDYIYAAHNITSIRNEIKQQFDISGNVSDAREALLDSSTNIGLYNSTPEAIRYMQLRDQAVNFYLSDSKMFEDGFQTEVSQGSGNYNGIDNNSNHKGIDIVGSRSSITGEQFNSIFSGIVANPSLNEQESYDHRILQWQIERPDDKSLEALLFHNGDESYWKDSQFGGNSVSIDHGFNFGNSFLSMGFSTRSNHFESILAQQGYQNAGTGIGTAGNTGSTTGPHIDWNAYINDPYGTGNFIGDLYNLKFNQAYQNTTGYRYYDPEDLWKEFR